MNKARELGIDEMLIVRNADNTGSKKAILKIGGVSDTGFGEDDGIVVYRFWIQL